MQQTLIYLATQDAAKTTAMLKKIKEEERTLFYYCVSGGGETSNLLQVALILTYNTMGNEKARVNKDLVAATAMHTTEQISQRLIKELGLDSATLGLGGYIETTLVTAPKSLEDLVTQLT